MAWLASATVHGGIDVEGHLGVLPGCLAQPSYVLGIVVGHENLVCIDVVAKHFRPRSPLQSTRSPFFQPRVQSLFMLLQIGQQFQGYTFLIYSVSQWGMVAGRLQHTNLVLYLYHADHVAARLADVLHKGTEGAVVSLEHLFRETTGNLQGLPGFRSGSRKTLGVLLEPQRSIARHTVLPRSEP